MSQRKIFNMIVMCKRTSKYGCGDKSQLAQSKTSRQKSCCHRLSLKQLDCSLILFFSREPIHIMAVQRKLNSLVCGVWNSPANACYVKSKVMPPFQPSRAEGGAILASSDEHIDWSASWNSIQSNAHFASMSNRELALQSVLLHVRIHYKNENQFPYGANQQISTCKSQMHLRGKPAAYRRVFFSISFTVWLLLYDWIPGLYGFFLKISFEQIIHE